MITLYPGLPTRTAQGEGDFFSVFEKVTGTGLHPFFSGRSAIVAGLRAFGLGRMDEILVPPYLGQCVLSAISRVAFPTMTSSSRTKAVLVLHQFGFPQAVNEIEKVARENGWRILNDCAHTFMSRVDGRLVLDWGDVSIVSLAKLYPCGLGGGLVVGDGKLDVKVEGFDEADAGNADAAFEEYRKIRTGLYGEKASLRIHGLYGYLPEISSMASGARRALPVDLSSVLGDVQRRKELLSIAEECLGERIASWKGDVVPFAIPVAGEPEELNEASRYLNDQFGADAPILHFDYAGNMLRPDYRPALILGCHEGWTPELIRGVAEVLA